MPVQKVNNELFFHVNSNANLSPYDLMRKGATVRIGESKAPFFRIYEAWQRTYPVTLKNGGVQEVPAMRFLNEVNAGNITPANLPQTAYEVANHFLMLARELLWETIRLNEFPEAPSRQRCIWLTRTLDQAREWVKILRFQSSTYSIVYLRAQGRALDTDGRLLAGESEPLPIWYDKARKYWRGELTEEPWPEVIFDGSVVVEDIVGS